MAVWGLFLGRFPPLPPSHCKRGEDFMAIIKLCILFTQLFFRFILPLFIFFLCYAHKDCIAEREAYLLAFWPFDEVFTYTHIIFAAMGTRQLGYFSSSRES